MNRSDRVLDGSLGRATRLVRDGAMIYQAVRNGLIAFGVTASIFLPLASQTTQQPISPTTVTLLPNVPVVVHNEINPVSTPVPSAGAPKIEVAVLTSPIQGAPPISRAWHRTTFSRTGDEFWALPDAEFKLRFTRGADFADCINREPANKDLDESGPTATCQGSFALTTDTGSSFRLITLPGRGIAFDPAVPEGCRVHGAPEALTPTAVCRIERTAALDLCIWLRRSEHLESKRYTQSGREVVDWLEETVALDVRWLPVEDKDECLALLPD